jgi:hypothetical protein
MTAKICHDNLEKEAIRRNLLANMLCSVNSEQIRNSQSTWGNFWQGLFKKARMF